MLPNLILLLSALLLMQNPLLLQAAEKQNPIKVIVFDFSGVIAHTNKDEVISFIAQSLHISKDDALEALNKLKQEYNLGKTEPDFWKEFAIAKGIKLPDHWMEKFCDARIRAIKEVPGMVNLVKELQKQGYQTALLSNASERTAAIRRGSRFYQLFQPAFFSADIGGKKPARKVYETLLAQLKVAPQAVIFIDNKEENIEAANAVGINGILFINTEQLIQELEKRGVKADHLQPML